MKNKLTMLFAENHRTEKQTTHLSKIRATINILEYVFLVVIKSATILLYNLLCDLIYYDICVPKSGR